MRIARITAPTSHGTRRMAPTTGPIPPAIAFPVTRGTTAVIRKPIVQIPSRILNRRFTSPLSLGDWTAAALEGDEVTAREQNVVALVGDARIARFHSSLSGYSVIRADGLDQPIAAARTCPVLHSGATIEVRETFNAM